MAKPAFALVMLRKIVAESCTEVDPKVWVNTAVAESAIEPANVNVSSASKLTDDAVITAWLGALENAPNESAAIAIIDTRLKNVFFDITFLSFVATETFPGAAGKDLSFAS